MKFAIILENEDGTTVTETVAIRHSDQLRAELEGPRQGLPGLEKAPLHYTGLWAWAALTRTKVITEPYQTFKNRVIELEPLDEEAPADPTSGSAGSD